MASTEVTATPISPSLLGLPVELLHIIFQTVDDLVSKIELQNTCRATFEKLRRAGPGLGPILIIRQPTGLWYGRSLLGQLILQANGLQSIRVFEMDWHWTSSGPAPRYTQAHKSAVEHLKKILPLMSNLVSLNLSVGFACVDWDMEGVPTGLHRLDMLLPEAAAPWISKLSALTHINTFGNSNPELPVGLQNYRRHLMRKHLHLETYHPFPDNGVAMQLVAGNVSLARRVLDANRLAADGELKIRDNAENLRLFFEAVRTSSWSPIRTLTLALDDLKAVVSDDTTRLAEKLTSVTIDTGTETDATAFQDQFFRITNCFSRLQFTDATRLVFRPEGPCEDLTEAGKSYFQEVVNRLKELVPLLEYVEDPFGNKWRPNDIGVGSYNRWFEYDL